VALVGLAACGGNTDSPTDSSATLVIQDLVVGTGATAVAGDTITVNYVGTFTNGTKFDASADHGGPFQFRVGVGGVIAGWDQGIPGMKVGGKRHLVIPPSLAYGNNPPQGIPSNATLVFDVDLLSIVGK
jgi:FKBP-type peptidyl-prolyl cis-trans isomerase